MTGKEFASFCAHMDERLDAIEKLLNLSLVSSVINQMDAAYPTKSIMDQRIEDLRNLLRQYDLCLEKKETYEDRIVVYIRSTEPINIVKARLISEVVSEFGECFVPVFMFEKLNGMQRKRMLEERISFCVQSKELYIVG